MLVVEERDEQRGAARRLEEAGDAGGAAAHAGVLVLEGRAHARARARALLEQGGRRDRGRHARARAQGLDDALGRARAGEAAERADRDGADLRGGVERERLQALERALGRQEPEGLGGVGAAHRVAAAGRRLVAGHRSGRRGDRAQPVRGLAGDLAQHLRARAAHVRALGGGERPHAREERLELVLLGDRRREHERAQPRVEVGAVPIPPVPQRPLPEQHDEQHGDQDRCRRERGPQQLRRQRRGHPKAAVTRARRARGLNGFVT
ncbi:hypothetical protein OVA14_06835 [Agrococcus sp. SL85]|nr:hypothetical protein [Agrococcus sp. SL85]WAC65118.1 hypothetical protein OVA14_06835 [Agrococcus sp. SL85]